MDGVTSQSTKPLQFIALAGLGLCGLSLIIGFCYAAAWLAGVGQDSPGFTTLVILQLFTLGINAAVVGVIGEYIGRVFDNVRGHPMSIVERTIERPPTTSLMHDTGFHPPAMTPAGNSGLADDGDPNLKKMILAGGLGTCLSEETDTRPKPLVEIGGLPILWHIMNIYEPAGLSDFVIFCG